ncbi:MAG: peptidoglycan DD-metalloendopeptidase family protein [Bacteroidales bacterium]|nr:peptidoglycan DD-metalloendopeptidase family protein [Bacteroidales bacterium]
MSSLIIYILKITLIFSATYSFFYIFLRKLTFHSLNRMILLIIIPLAFLIPFLDFGNSQISPNNLIFPTFDEVNFSTQLTTNQHIETSEKISFNFNIILWLYLLGLGFNVFKLVKNAFKLILLKQNSETFYRNGYLFIEADIKSVFSGFGWIFVPKNKLNSYKNPIIEHEKAHVDLLHFVDLILTEIFIIFQWFNPFVYFYRKTLKTIHEFQADEKVLKGDVKKSQYLEILLQNFEHENLFGFQNNFNGLTLKKRVKMITKNKSSKIKIAKYLLMIPVIAFLTVAFAKNANNILPEVAQNISVLKKSDNLPSIFPIKEGEYIRISTGFEDFYHPFKKKIVHHNGLDIVADEGTEIIATADGIVVTAEFKEGWGNLVVIKHDTEFDTYYAHLKNFNVKKGDKVTKEQVIGYVGNTGMSTAPHLHYEVRKNDEPQDPKLYY